MTRIPTKLKPWFEARRRFKLRGWRGTGQIFEGRTVCFV